MKHLISIMAVFLLMGCQTTETTAEDISSPKSVAEKEVKAPMVPYQTVKPVLCADSETVHENIMDGPEEKPILFWKDGSDSYFSALWMNEKTRTLTVLEYPNGPEIACFTSTGKDAVWSKNKELKTKGSAIRHLTQ